MHPGIIVSPSRRLAGIILWLACYSGEVSSSIPTSVQAFALAVIVATGCGTRPSAPGEEAPAPRREDTVEANHEVIPRATDGVDPPATTTAITPSDDTRAAEEAARQRAEAARLHPMYGVAFHFLARIHDTPSPTATVVGYMRRGATFRASERLAGMGCDRGWHRLMEGAFVCRGAGFSIGSVEQTFSPAPSPARRDSAMPYAFAFATRKSTPQYFRIPTVDEENAIATLFTRLDAADAARAAGLLPVRDAGLGIRDAGVSRLDAGASVSHAPSPATVMDVRGVPATATPDVSEGEPPSDESSAMNLVDGGMPATPEDGLPDYVRMRMLRRFYVSVDGSETDGDRAFTRTVRGAYVRSDALTPNEPPTRTGLRLTEETPLPVGFVYRTEIRRMQRSEGSALRPGDVLAQHTPLVITETTTVGGSTYYTSRDGYLVRNTAVRVARLRQRPARIPDGAKWIHIDLSEQMLVAYEGDRPVFATTVSTGRPGFATRTGTYRIQTKHVTSTMDDLAAGDEAYSIEDVPWTMFYDGGYALHASFWHNQYGRVRSHGCVNLSPPDAHLLFDWSTPSVPEHWHGAFATTRDPGTYIFIEN